MEIILKRLGRSTTMAKRQRYQRRSKLDNPDAGHDAQHNAWMADKIADGCVCMKKKDEMLKTHHCIVAFENCRNSNRKKMHYLLTL
jgi:hypothetical protein